MMIFPSLDIDTSVDFSETKELALINVLHLSRNHCCSSAVHVSVATQPCPLTRSAMPRYGTFFIQEMCA